MNFLNESLKFFLLCLAFSLYIFSVFTMFFIRLTVFSNNIPIEIADKAFQYTSSLFRNIVIPFSFNVSNANREQWLEDVYIAKIMLAMFLIPVWLIIMLGMAISDVVKHGMIHFAINLAITLWLLVFYYKNFALLREKCFELLRK